MTPGTCGFLSCGSKRGDVDCVDGQCVCKPGACSVNGVCTQKCVKATDGKCKILDCKARRHASCESGQCMCGKDECAFDGNCMSGRVVEEMFTGLATNMTMKENAVSDVHEEDIGSFPDMVATYLDRLPDHNNPQVLAIAASFVAGVIISTSVFQAISRRRSTSTAAEPLLGA